VPRRAWLWLFVLASLWGASYLFIKVALRDLSPEAIVFARTALAALVLAPVALRLGAFGPLRGRLGALLVLAVVQVAAPFLLIALGERSISSSLTGILVATAPIFTALIALRLDDEERVGRAGLVGVGVGLAGVALIVGVEIGGSGVAGALASSTMSVSALLMLPAAIVTAPDELPATAPALSILALGVGGTGIAFVIFYWLIASVGPAKASLVAYVAPGFALVYGVTVLDERLTVTTLVGLALVVGGSWLAAEGRSPARQRAQAGSPVGGGIPPGGG
jgi:drug/metabolite transporter (DMT)-like permease